LTFERFLLIIFQLCRRLAAAAAAVVITSCISHKAPITGRREMLLMAEGWAEKRQSSRLFSLCGCRAHTITAGAPVQPSSPWSFCGHPPSHGSRLGRRTLNSSQATLSTMCPEAVVGGKINFQRRWIFVIAVLAYTQLLRVYM